MMTEEERIEYLNSLARSGQQVPMATGLMNDPEKNTWMNSIKEAPANIAGAFSPDNAKQMFHALTSAPAEQNDEQSMFQKLKERFK